MKTTESKNQIDDLYVQTTIPLRPFIWMHGNPQIFKQVKSSFLELKMSLPKSRMKILFPCDFISLDGIKTWGIG